MNPLLDMASARPRRAKIKPREEAAHFSSLCKDKDGFDVKFRGEVITESELENRQKVYHNALKISTEAETLHEDAAMTSESHYDDIQQNCKHELVSSVVPSLEKCARCRGPFAPLKQTLFCKPQNVLLHLWKTTVKMYTSLENPWKISVDVAQALALPKESKERKKMLNKLRNKGNYKHNKEVLTSGSGLLKLRRKSKKEYDSKDYVHCMYCQALYLRKDLWRHVRICSLKPAEANAGSRRTRVLSMASMAESTLCQQISPGVWKLLTAMTSDDISAVRSDFCILQLAQSFFNKHGQDPTKYDYIRQKLREDAVRPANFHVVIRAVKRVSGFKEEKHFYQTPSLALKLGHSLRKICDIIHCRALMAEDTDVQLLHQHLEKTASLGYQELEKTPSPHIYGKLCKATLAKTILFNRRRGGEVSKMHVKGFLERDTTALHKDVAVGLSKFEQKR
ncbi:hypothetical protein F7725_021435, partial [Dissostichus mawsoni]